MRLTCRGGLVAGAAILALLAGPAPARAEVIFGLTTGNQIVVFDSANPGSILQTNTVTGLGAATLVGIDFRPADGALIGVAQTGATGAVFQINPFTGAATQIAAIPALTGTAFGVDFNPVPNALRIVSNAEQNLRITAGGAVPPGAVFADTNLSPAGNVVAAAYSNNFAGATTTTLFVVDSVSGQLLIQGAVNPPGPNGGVLSGGLSLGRGTNLTQEIGFDISEGGTAFLSIGNALFTVNLATGATTPLGTVGGPALRNITAAPAQVAGAIIPEPASLAVFGALTGLAVVARRSRKK